VATNVVERSFLFSHIKYQVEEKTVLKTIYVPKIDTKVNWYFAAGGFIAGLLLGRL